MLYKHTDNVILISAYSIYRGNYHRGLGKIAHRIRKIWQIKILSGTRVILGTSIYHFNNYH